MGTKCNVGNRGEFRQIREYIGLLCRMKNLMPDNIGSLQVVACNRFEDIAGVVACKNNGRIGWVDGDGSCRGAGGV